MLPARKKKLQLFAEQWNLELKDLKVLNVAFIHPTYAFESKRSIESNQRLEFLGDAVLGLIVGEYLFHTFPHFPEGKLTKTRAALVCEHTLAEKAREIGMGNYLLLGKGEKSNGGSQRASILADCFEAVIGAIYLECGINKAKDFIMETIIKELDSVLVKTLDSKTLLQEHLQKKGQENVNYQLLDEDGPDHDKSFKIGVYYQNRLLADAWGKNKKEAEQKAAQLAMETMQ